MNLLSQVKGEESEIVQGKISIPANASKSKQFMTQRDKFFIENEDSNRYVIFGDINNPMGDFKDHCLTAAIDLKHERSYYVPRSKYLEEIKRVNPEINEIQISTKSEKSMLLMRNGQLLFIFETFNHEYYVA